MAEVIFEAENRYRELLIGCGRDHKKYLAPEGKEGWRNLITLDMDVSCNPDYVHDLNNLPLPFESETFDEIHAYEVLEHVGKQGDFETFFAQFAEFWRLLKPEGYFFGSVPCWDSQWAWGDPGHTRVITPGTLYFLDQANYETKDNPMTDYRGIWKHSFKFEGQTEKNERFWFVLRKQ